MGQGLVIGQALTELGVGRQVEFALRRVGRGQGGAEGGPAVLVTQRFVLPFRQVGQGGQRSLDQLAQLARRQLERRRVDGFDGRDILGLVEGQQVVRMRHLQLAAELFDLAADDACGADGVMDVEAADAVKIDEVQPVIGVGHLDTPRAVGRRFRIAGDGHVGRLDFADTRHVQGHHRSFDDAGRQQEGQVANDRTDMLGQRRGDLRSDALYGGDTGEIGE